MAKELPYFKFEPSEWDNGNIQMLSREDKGLFIDICSMYWSRLGDLPEKLVTQKLCGGNATALNSLCDEGIISVIDGLICINFLNEQLSEFEDVSKTNRENALKGWDKRRKEATAKRPHSERKATAMPEEKRREEEIREDKRKEDITSSSEEDEAEAFKVKKILDLYNQKAETSSFPKCQKLTEQRKKIVKARIKDYGLAKCEEAVEVASKSDFLNGKNDRSWVLSFDWLFNPNNFVKVIEGKYNNKTQTQPTIEKTESSGWSMEKFWAERKERKAKEEKEKTERLKRTN